ncbi:PH domain-containing protein [Clostridium rectalis]|uniref:PH domain-containing protein n=1 Tax=Clostridium rectalis TaxID=2040295 RepID=UPI000F62FDD9|nr:PH domain-containing protein [Clostridium rectalis]
MEYSKLNSNSKKSWFVARAITTIIFFILSEGIKYFLMNKLNILVIVQYNKIINICIAIIILLLLLNTLIYPLIEYNQWRYSINKDKIEFREGIYTITTTTIPVVRVQHIKVKQGPINRIFKLANIQIFTAGGVHIIPNIEIEKAEEISCFLKDKIREKAEEHDRETY